MATRKTPQSAQPQAPETIKDPLEPTVEELKEQLRELTEQMQANEQMYQNNLSRETASRDELIKQLQRNYDAVRTESDRIRTDYAAERQRLNDSFNTRLNAINDEAYALGLREGASKAALLTNTTTAVTDPRKLLNVGQLFNYVMKTYGKESVTPLNMYGYEKAGFELKLPNRITVRVEWTPLSMCTGQYRKYDDILHTPDAQIQARFEKRVEGNASDNSVGNGYGRMGMLTDSIDEYRSAAISGNGMTYAQRKEVPYTWLLPTQVSRARVDDNKVVTVENIPAFEEVTTRGFLSPYEILEEIKRIAEHPGESSDEAMRRILFAVDDMLNNGVAEREGTTIVAQAPKRDYMAAYDEFSYSNSFRAAPTPPREALNPKDEWEKREFDYVQLPPDQPKLE